LPRPSGVRKRHAFDRAPTPADRFALDAGSDRSEFHATVYAYLADTPWTDNEKRIDLAQLVADLQESTNKKRADIQTALRHLPLYLALHGFECKLSADGRTMRVICMVPPLTFENACI
jgi:hypothetical protein